MSSAAREVSSLGVLDAADRVAVFHRTLADLCRSQVPLPEALRAAADDLGGGPLAHAVRAMATDCEHGASLGEAYAARADGMPRLYRGLVEAGIAAGDLPSVLDEIAAHAEARAEIETRLRRALAYPLFAASFVIVVGIVLAVTIGPKLEAFGDEIAFGAPELTTFASRNGGSAVGSSWMFSSWFPVALIVAIAALGAGIVAVFAAVRRPLDRSTGVTALAFRWPVLGRLRLYATLSTFSAALAILLRRRTSLSDALALSAAACDEPQLRARVERMAEQAEAGASLAEALRDGGVLAPSLVWTVDAAERRGEAPDALDQVAAVYRDRLARAADRAALWVTPAAEVFVGLLVLLVAASFLGKLMALTRLVFTAG